MSFLQDVEKGAKDRLALLQDSARQWTDYQSEVEELQLWMQNAREQMKARDNTLPLREQLAIQEVGSSFFFVVYHVVCSALESDHILPIAIARCHRIADILLRDCRS